MCKILLGGVKPRAVPQVAYGCVSMGQRITGVCRVRDTKDIQSAAGGMGGHGGL